MPQDPPTVFFILYMLQNNFQVKTALEIYVEIWCPLPEKVSEYAAGVKTFLKGLIYAFSGFNVLVFS